VLLADLVDTSNRIASTSKRLEKTDLLAGLLKRLAREEAGIAVAFLSGGARQGRIGIGHATLRSANGPAVETPALTLAEVDRTLTELAGVEGRGSEQRKREVLNGLFARATVDEQHFLFRLLMGELRQGALEGIMLDGLAKATGIPLDRIRRAAMMAGSATTIAPAVLEHGERGLSQFDVQLFRPVQPMLAQTAEDVNEALHELGEAAFEYKFDGARVQVHKADDQVAVYSRGMNEVSAAVPEIVDAVRSMPARELILDGEVLSLDAEGRPQPFQVSMRRFGRKLDVDRMLAELSDAARVLCSAEQTIVPYSLPYQSKARRAAFFHTTWRNTTWAD
jgi:DNA ligase 1